MLSLANKIDPLAAELLRSHQPGTVAMVCVVRVAEGGFFDGFSDKRVSTLGCCRAAGSFIYLAGTTGAQTLPSVLCRLLACRG